MSSVPVIAVASCSALGDYLEAVRRAGGTPMVLDAGRDRPSEVVASAAGLLLTGGADLDPALFGEAPHPSFAAAEPGRDAFELELASRACEAKLPLLAICRGLQVLNVACGGTLVQDIPDQLSAAAPHMIRQPSTALAHAIDIVTDSLLDRTLGETSPCPVNSRHHQAVKTPGRDLVVSATAPDGVVEAIECREHAFCLGVQWHPENFVRNGRFAALFEELVRHATRR